MKKIKKIILFLSIVCAAKVFSVNNFEPNSVANAYEINVYKIDSDGAVSNGDFKFRVEKNGNAELINFNRESKDINIIIPNSIRFEGKIYSVTSIGDKCFYFNKNLQNINIPESVTSLGKNCFCHSGIRNITIPESVTSLGNYCFACCKNLQNINIPESVTSFGDGCFGDCSSLKTLLIPESVTSLGDHCFYNCCDLRNITIPKSVTSLGNYCFAECKSLQNIEIPSSVTSMGEGCFLPYCEKFKISLVKNQFSDYFQKQLVALGFKNVTILNPHSAENESLSYKNLYKELLKNYKELSNNYKELSNNYKELLKSHEELLMQKEHISILSN